MSDWTEAVSVYNTDRRFSFAGRVHKTPALQGFAVVQPAVLCESQKSKCLNCKSRGHQTTPSGLISNCYGPLLGAHGTCKLDCAKACRVFNRGVGQLNA